MAKYVRLSRLEEALSRFLAPGAINLVLASLQDDILEVPDKADLDQLAALVSMIRAELTEPLGAVAQEVRLAAAAVAEPQPTEEVEALAQGLATVLRAAGQEDLAGQVEPLVEGLQQQARILDLVTQLENLIGDLRRALEGLPEKYREWAAEAHQLAIDHLLKEGLTGRDLQISSEVTRLFERRVLAAIFWQLALNPALVPGWDRTWTTVEALPSDLRMLIRSAIRE